LQAKNKQAAATLFNSASAAIEEMGLSATDARS